jgi:hypothetical protein
VLEIINRAFNPMIKFLLANDEGIHYQGVSQELRDRWYHGGLDRNETSVNLRLDWAISVDALDDGILGGVNNLMFNQAKMDLTDLLVNGDIDDSNDALLKSFNGILKRNQDIEDLQIISAVMYSELRGVSEEKPRGDVREYTLYIRPYVKWKEHATVRTL